MRNKRLAANVLAAGLHRLLKSLQLLAWSKARNFESEKVSGHSHRVWAKRRRSAGQRISIMRTECRSGEQIKGLDILLAYAKDIEFYSARR